MQIDKILTLVTDELTKNKGQEISIINVQDRTSIADFMVIVTSTSSRHSYALSNYVSEKIKQAGLKPLGFEGDKESEWVLLDLGDIIVHLMTTQARELYQLEKLWSLAPSTAVNA